MRGFQVGSANLRVAAALTVPTDLEAVRSRRQVQRLTGSHLRNQAYYDLAKHSGVHGVGNNVGAPAYIIAAVEAALPWGKGGTPGNIPAAHCDKLEESPYLYDADIQAAIGILEMMIE